MSAIEKKTLGKLINLKSIHTGMLPKINILFFSFSTLRGKKHFCKFCAFLYEELLR